MQVWHQKNILKKDFPFRIILSANIEYPPHWHEELEIIYALEGNLQVGLNNENYLLKQGDILLVGTGDVHYFLSSHEWRKVMVMQVGISLFEAHASHIRDKKFIFPLLNGNENYAQTIIPGVYEMLERQLSCIREEFISQSEGHGLVIKSRLYDILAIILRDIPMEKYTGLEKRRRLDKLERLNNVFSYVEENYSRDITLEDAARLANFSTYHFTRFFKDTAGMTFGQYLTKFRVGKAEWLLSNSGETITQIAFKSGFNSIKTFNRVFKQLKGCPPSNYRKAIIE